MSQPSPEDQKKALVRGLSGLLRVSPVSADVDPKNFFMMVSSNYSILVQGNRLDLNPLWEPLAAQSSPDALIPLFLKFSEKGAQLGFQVAVPPSIESLSDEEKVANLALFEKQQGGTPLPQLEPVFQQTGDLHRKVLQSVVYGFRSSPVGQKVDSSQLNYFIGERLGELFDGRRFDCQPVVEALREQGVTDEDIYLGVASAQERLQTLDVVMPDPLLSLSGDIKQELLRRAKEKEALPPPDRGKPSKPAEPKPSPQLQDLGLGVQKKNPRRAMMIRLGAVGLVAMALAAVAIASRPTRSLSLAPYAQTLPLTDARLVDGAFQGVMDLKAWAKLPKKERQERYDAFEATIRKQGMLRDLQIRDTEGKLVIVTTNKGLRAPPSLLE